MTVVFLTSASTSPWSKPGDWADAGSQVELVGAGGVGGAGATGSSRAPGGGASGGAYLKLTSPVGSLGSTTPFAAKASNTSTTDADTLATFWEGTTTTNTYEAKAGLQGTAAPGTGGRTGGTGVTNGTPSPVTYTTATFAGGTSVFTATGGGIGGTGGCGGGGPNGAGGAGGSQLSVSPGTGGSGSDGGAAGGSQQSTTLGGNGGNGFGGTGGGAGGTSTGGNATANSGGGGGGGGQQSTGGVSCSGGAAAADVIWTQTTPTATAGCGGGGGGGGNNNSSGSTTTACDGGAAANYGGGGGGGGPCRPGGGSTSAGGAAGGGIIIITYTGAVPPNIWGWDMQEGGRITKRNFPRERRAAAGMRGIDGTDAPFITFMPAFDAINIPRYPDPTVARRRRAAASTEDRDDGTEQVFIGFQPMGWEVAPPSPLATRPQRHHRYGAYTEDRDDGAYVQLVPPPTPWFETNLPTPLSPYALKSRYQLAAGTMRGIDGTEARFNPFAPLGWDPTQATPLTPYALSWRFQRASSVMRGDDGIAAPFSTFVPETAFEANLPNPLTPWALKVRSQKIAGAMTEDRDDGDYVQLVPPIQAWFESNLPTPLTPYGLKYRFQRVASILRGDEGTQGALAVFQPMGFDETFSQDRHLTALHRPAAIFQGHQGIELPIPPPPIIWGYDIQQQPTRSWPYGGTRGASIARGIDGTEGVLQAFQPMGFEETLAQDRHLTALHRPAATFRGLDGIELPIPPPFVTFFDLTASQDRYSRTRTYGALMPKADGIESPFVNWINLGFDAVASQDRHPAFLHRPGATFRGADGIEFPIPPPAPPWFEVTPPFSAHPRPERSGGLMRGIDGIESQFNPFNPFSFAPTFSQEPHIRRERWAAIARGHDGTDLPLPPILVPWGETTPAVTLHRLFRSPDVGDAGIEAPFIPFVAMDWPSPPPTYKQPPTWRSGALARGDDGAYVQTALIQNLTPFGWPEPPMHQRPPTWRAGATMLGDDGIEGVFVFVPPGLRAFNWEDRQAQEQLRVPPTRRMGSLFGGDPGNEAPFTPFAPFGFEQVFAPPPHRIWKSPEFGDALGINAPFAPFVAMEWPWVATHPHPRPERSGALALGDGGIASPFAPFRPFDWPWTPHYAHPRPERAGAIARGTDGIEFPFAPFTPMEWPWQAMYRHPRPERAGAVARGHDGIEFPFTLPLSAWFETTPPLSRFKGYRTPDIGDGGIEAQFIPPQVLQPLGWEIQPPQPPHPWPRQRGNTLRGDDGAYVQLVPPAAVPLFEFPFHLLRKPKVTHSALKLRSGFAFFSPWVNQGFDQIVPPQPPHPRPEQRSGAIARGDEGVQAPFIRWQNLGFEAVSSQEPHPRRERYGSLIRGIDGIELMVPPPPPPPSFFETTPPLTRFRGYRSPEPGDTGGIDFPYIRFQPMGWEVQPVQPPRRYQERRGLFMRGDEGHQAPLIRFFPQGWEPTPPLLFRRPLPRVPVFLLWSVESYGKFVPPSPPASAHTDITAYSAATGVAGMELKLIIDSFKAVIDIKRRDT